jgi:hypothetical protein
MSNALTRRLIVTVPVAAVLAISLIDVGIMRAAPVLPDFSPANFTPGAPIDNPFLPWTPGTRLRYAANVTDDEGQTVLAEDEDFVTSDFETIAGVQARVVHARSWEDGVQIEDTRDFYAQDNAGNVWYMGEDTKSFERDDQGNIISTDTTGSWRAGVDGAKPGFAMPADHTIGFNYFQENAPNNGALDQATILSTTETVSTPAGDFSDVLKTQEETELEPGAVEFKYYASGIGQVLAEEDVVDGVPQARFELQSVTTDDGGGGGGGGRDPAARGLRAGTGRPRMRPRARAGAALASGFRARTLMCRRIVTASRLSRR